MDLYLLIDKVAEKGMGSYRLSKWLGVNRMAVYRKLAGREAEILKDILDLTNLEALERKHKNRNVRRKFKMATVLRPELSQKNKYYIEKHRYYELKHFCLQYPEWRRIYNDLNDASISLSMMENVPSSNLPGDPTAKEP